ncbi:MAG TPA: hypothetical protein VFT45_12390 [Longimicrobium sp.]|nr:hypothetical protein [Longimicrobium sp.]
MWTCSTCGEVHEAPFSSCWKCDGSPAEGAASAAKGSASAAQGTVSAAQGTATVRVTPSQPTVSVANFGPASKRRYAEAYTSARTFSLIGKVVKVIGLLMFMLGVAALMSSGGSRNEYGGGGDPAAAMMAGLTAILGGVVFMMGLFMAAQAQLQMSSLDTAVNTSPFLTDIQRAETLRLRAG